jgi:hypothetical protein
VIRGAVFAIALTAAGPGWADFQDGTGLLERCREAPGFGHGYCFGYVAAISDVMRRGEPMAGHRACIPPSVTQGQVVEVSIRWLEANPQHRDYVARSLIAAALSETFPCR